MEIKFVLPEGVSAKLIPDGYVLLGLASNHFIHTEIVGDDVLVIVSIR